MEMKFKTTPEWSDNGNYSYASSMEEILSQTNATSVRLYGDDIVSAVYGQPLEKVVGTWLFREGRWFVANYLYSSITKRDGRAEAYHLIENIHKPLDAPQPTELKTSDQLVGTKVAFDIETGGKSKIRCISFYDGKSSLFIDCRDIKSNKSKKELLVEIFTNHSYRWIAHYGYHDMTELCKVLGIPEFPLYKDTIWFHRKVEFRSLRYLSAVYLGAICYKDELNEANLTEDFALLCRYCCKDSFYTYKLAEKFTQLNLLRPTRLLNQVLHVMSKPPLLSLEHSIYELYPQFKGMSKTELKKQLLSINPKHVQLFLKSVNSPKPTIGYHSLDGLTVRIPEGLTTDIPLWMIPMEGKSVMDIMAHDVRYDSIELSVYRHNNNISPTKHWGDYDVFLDDIFILNDVVCLVTKEYPDSIPVKFNEVKGLFYV